MSNAKNHITIMIGQKARWKSMDVQYTTWGDFVEDLRNPVRTSETIEQYLAMSRDEQGLIKDIGWYIAGFMEGTERKGQNLKDRCAITLDIDHASDLGFLEAYSQFEYVCHSTHKHTPESPRLRLVLLLDRPVSREEYEPLAREVSSWSDIEIFDRTTYQASRVMHKPSTACDGEYVFVHNEGMALDKETIEMIGAIDYKDPSTWKVSRNEKSAPRISGEECPDPRTRKGIVGAFCEVYDVYDVIDMLGCYEEGEGGRYTYEKSTGSNGAVVYDDGLFFYSHHESDPCFGKNMNAFDVWKTHTFGTDKDAFDKAIRKAKTIPEVKEVLDRYSLEEAMGDDVPEWADQLEINKDGKVVGNDSNAEVIFQNDQHLSKNVAFNLFTGDTVLRGEMPWHDGDFIPDTVNGNHFDDFDGHMMKAYVRRQYGVSFSQEVLHHATVVQSAENAFHPVRDYLKSLAWDGKKRIETMFIDYLGSEDNCYTREAARIMMTAAVKRVFMPGCKYDYVVVLEGGQGQRKSTFIKTLARSWFTEGLKAIGGKETIEVMRGKWIIEVAELHALSRTQIEEVKAFVTTEVDRMRPAYARRVEDFPRQCIFIGSSNRSDYLKDQTGNRRFWPMRVNVPVIDSVKLESEIGQLWAEAVVLFKESRERVKAGELIDGHELILSKEAVEIVTREQEARMEEDPIEGLILDYIDQEVDVAVEQGEEPCGLMAPRSMVCVRQIQEDVIDKAGEAGRYKNAVYIAQILKKHGWTGDKNGHGLRIRSKRWGRQRFYMRSDE